MAVFVKWYTIPTLISACVHVRNGFRRRRTGNISNLSANERGKAEEALKTLTTTNVGPPTFHCTTRSGPVLNSSEKPAGPSK